MSEATRILVVDDDPKIRAVTSRGLFVVPAFGVIGGIVAAGAALACCVAGGVWASRASAHRA